MANIPAIVAVLSLSLSISFPAALYATDNRDTSSNTRADETRESNRESTMDTRQNRPQLIPYTPPVPARPTPKVRVSVGGVRGSGEQIPVVTLLVPEHVALTTAEHPPLYWHLSEKNHNPAVFTLICDDATEPLLTLALPEPMEAGVHSIHLADYGIHLEIGKLYEWSVRILEGSNDSYSGDVVARAFIERVPAEYAVRNAMTYRDVMLRARAFAHSALWYDALAELFAAEDSGSTEARMEIVRKSLFKQVDLDLSPAVIEMD